jgi:rRNA-processing protein EBP2
MVTYPHTIDVAVEDDLQRELALYANILFFRFFFFNFFKICLSLLCDSYKQALHGANNARSLASKHAFPFTRPPDYFAEMVKSDTHMERIRQRLLDEKAVMKKSDDRRKEREGKKFGKQVQVEKLKEREKAKKEMGDRLKILKRSKSLSIPHSSRANLKSLSERKDVLDKPQADDDAFDVAVEDAISDRPSKRSREAGGSRVSRDARNKKYGFGGAGRRSKQNTRESTDNFNFGSGRSGGRGESRGGRGGRGASRGGRGGRGGGLSGVRSSGDKKRLGKTRRMNARSKV